MKFGLSYLEKLGELVKRAKINFSPIFGGIQNQ